MHRDLKPRETEILRLLAVGQGDRAIAARLNLATETVRWYNKQIYAALGVTSRAAAVRQAIALGVLSAPVDLAASVPERSPIRYLSNAGVSIAWQTIGSGPVDLVFMAGFVSHLELLWENPEYAAFTESLARHARVIVFDRRGVGLSDRSHGASTLEDTISDARAVMTAAGATRAFVAGTSESGAAAVLLASMHPQLVHGLILIAATPMPARRSPDPEWARPWDAFLAMIDTMQRTWGEPWSIERLAPSRVGDPAFAAWWGKTLRAASSPSSVRLIMERTMQVDIRALLPQVPTRALVIHRTGDAVVPIAAGRFLAARMPNASLVELPGSDHVWFVNGLDIAAAIVRFLASPHTVEVETWLAIVLHVTGPGSMLDTEKERILAAFSALHVQRTPSGWTALFDAPHRAIQCAKRLRALGRGRAAGMALHVGACRTTDGAPVGTAHAVGVRLAGLAKPGEILVSATLRDILAGVEVALVPRSLDGGDEVTPPTTVWAVDDSE